MAQILFPWAYVPDPTSGRPIALGQMFFGIKDLDPEIPLNQITVNVKQEDGTLLAVPQPILLNSGGVPTYNGSPVILDIDEQEFSAKVLTSLGAQVYYNENNIPYSWGTNQIEDGAITTVKLADGSVTTIKLADDSVDKDKIFSDVAGNGLGQNIDGSLEVNVDDSTLEINADIVRVKAGGITDNEIADGTIDGAKIADNSLTALQIASNAVGASELANDSVNANNMINPTNGTTYIIKRLIQDGSLWAETSDGNFPSSRIFRMGSSDRFCGFTCLNDGSARFQAEVRSQGGVSSQFRLQRNGVDYIPVITVLSGATLQINESISFSLGDHFEFQQRAFFGSQAGMRDVKVLSGTKVGAIA